MKWLILFAGGGAGTILRYLLADWTTRHTGTSFPFGTLMVNLTGCLVIGLLAGWSAGRLDNDSLQLFLFTGLMGGFTTFSSFALETWNLIRAGSWLFAISYVLVSNLGGLSLAFAGYKLLR